MHLSRWTQGISVAILGYPHSWWWPKMGSITTKCGDQHFLDTTRCGDKKLSVIAMWANNLWWLKFFSRPVLWRPKLFNHHIKGGGPIICFWKALNEGFPNRCDKLAFYGDQKIPITIGTLNQKHWLPQVLVTIKFSNHSLWQSKNNLWATRCSDQIVLVATRFTLIKIGPIIMSSDNVQILSQLIGQMI